MTEVASEFKSLLLNSPEAADVQSVCTEYRLQRVAAGTAVYGQHFTYLFCLFNYAFVKHSLHIL